MRTSHRIAALATAVALLISPVAATAASAAGPQMTGTVTSGWAWVDATLDAEMTVGVPYSSSVQGPAGGGWAPLTVNGLPDGLTATLNEANGVITVTGTPTTAESPVSFSFSYAQDSEVTFTIEFEGAEVIAATDATSTSVSAVAYQPYHSVQLDAYISATGSTLPTGTVTFKFGTTTVGTGTVQQFGVTTYATFVGTVSSSYIGTTQSVTAVYSGDENNSASTSSAVDVYIYGSRVVSGYYVRNGVGTEGEQIRLLSPSAVPTAYTDVTDAGGYFEISLPAPSSLSDATATYVIHAADSDFYYSDSTVPGEESPFGFAAATATGDAQWEEWLNIYDFRDPIWIDETLAQPRMGESYTDGVAADPQGSGGVTYSATGDVPSWLTLFPMTGGLVSTGPTDQTAQTFTVRATSDFGYIEKQFTLQAGDAAVPPTFTDTTIADLTVGTPLADAIAATGDATIVYSSTTLPPGLTLNPTTGALTGTPTTAGDYVVTFTASNGVNPDATFIWEPTIAAAPELDLTLNFAPGTTIDTATTEIGAGNLQVGSTYTLYMHSTPRLLYTGTIDATGAFLHTITLPADTPVGAHELILTGVAPDGTVLTARAWFTLLPNGTIGAISYVGPLSFSLAATGSDPLLPLGLAGGLLLAGYLVARRRSEQA